MQDEKENLLKFNWMCRTASVAPLLHLLPLFSLYELVFFYHLPFAISSCLFVFMFPFPAPVAFRYHFHLSPLLRLLCVYSAHLVFYLLCMSSSSPFFLLSHIPSFFSLSALDSNSFPSG